MRPQETKICGLPSVRARFQKDASSILRLYFDYETSRKIGMMCRVLAAGKKIYRCVEKDELERIAGSLHHGGIVAVVPSVNPKEADEASIAAWARRRESLLALDRVGNAHNLGAIARTAAFFGIPRLVIAGSQEAARPSDAAYRVAEGGLDHVEIWTSPDMAGFARSLAAHGFDVVGAATRSGAAPKRRPAAQAPAWGLFLGNEEEGLAPSVAAACTRLVTIPGTGHIESLNVSVAAAVMIHQLLSETEINRSQGRKSGQGKAQ